MRANSLQSCQTLCNTDCNLPGSSVHGILQARILEWVAVPSSRDEITSKTRFAGRISVTLWKEAHVSLPIREHHLIHWCFLNEKKKITFSTFFTGTVFPPPTPQSPQPSPTAGFKEILNYVIAFVLRRFDFLGSVHRSWVSTSVKSFDWWCINCLTTDSFPSSFSSSCVS